MIGSRFPRPGDRPAGPDHDQGRPAEPERQPGGPRPDTGHDRAAGPAPAAAAGAAPDSLLFCLIRMSQEFGRPVGEADLRAICPIPADGMAVETFCLAAQRLGYKARPIAIGGAGLAGLPTPFVLVDDAVGAARVVLGDPGATLTAVDPVTGAAQELAPDWRPDAGWRAILLKPSSAGAGAAVRGGARWRTLVLDRIKRVVWELALASLMINLFALATPLFLMTVYNKVIAQNALSTLNVLVVGMAVVYGFDFLLRGVRGYVSSHTGARIDALIGSEVVHHLLHLPYRYYETTPSGVIGERLRQLDTVRQFFCGPLPITLVDLLFVGVFAGVLFWINTVLAAIVLAAIPAFVALSLALHQRQKGLVERNFMALAAKGSALAETMNNALTIKSLGLEGEVEKRWGERLAASAWTSFKAGNAANLIAVVSSVLQQSVGLAVIYIGALSVTAGEMSIGALIAASMLGSRAIAPMRQVVSAWYQMQEVRAAFQRIEELLDEPTEARPGELAPPPPIAGRLGLEAVHFAYGDGRPPVIKGIDLTIERGILGIIGPFGSGKSTLAKLIQGLYVPDSGRVMIDGVDIKQIPPAVLRREIGVVPQESQLFAGSVRDNIAMGTAFDGQDRVVAAAKFVGAHDFIQDLPKGYNTLLGEHGAGLSAGQRQLICIARAIIRNPRILIFDEATSALDVAAEQHIMRNLRRAASGRTIVLISHRLAPMAHADKVALLVDGRIEHVGSAAEAITRAKARLAEQGSEAGS